MKKTTRLFLLLFLLALVTGIQAQYQNTSGQKREGEVQKKELKKKKKKKKNYFPWFVGGIFGAGFSSYSAYIQLSPLIGYKITPAFHVGTRLTYIYSSYEITPSQRDNYNDYGASIFARYIFFKGLFAQAEYEALNYEYYDRNAQNHAREWLNSLFIGAGYFMNMGGRGFASFAILFNVLENEYSPYTNPIIRIGFGVGF